MNETTGKTDFETQLDSILEEYKDAKNISFPELNKDVSKYFTMDRDYIEALSREELYSIAVELNQFALYIQQLENREKARITFCNSTINSVAAQHWNSYSDYLKYDLKINLIAKENSTLDKAIRIRNNAQVRVDELSGIADSIRSLASTLSRSAYGKERE